MYPCLSCACSRDFPASVRRDQHTVSLRSPFPRSKANQTTSDLKRWQAWLQGKLGLFATKDYLETALKDTNERLVGLSHRNFDPKRVYITYQTEQAQRKCLKAVETGRSLQHIIFTFFSPLSRTMRACDGRFFTALW